MQVIQINSLTGHSPYDITICDITNTYCYSGMTGVTTVPLTINIPNELVGTTELLIVVTDSIGCQEIQYHNCSEPTPTSTQTPTPTPTPTNITCNCISIENPSGITLNFGYIQCSGLPFYGPIYSSTTLFVCGKLPYGDTGLIINISSNICVNDECPGPTPTPTTTPTPTPTLPPIVGYFEDSCDSSNQFTLSNIPISFSPLSGAYYVESSGFIGCATYVVSSSTNNFYSFIAMGSQPSTYHCQIANFIYPCPTLTPTPSVTPTITPTSTITPTPTLTQTPTNTPTPSMDYRLYQIISCCDRSIVRFMNLPTYFLPGMVVVSNDGYCYSIQTFTKSIPVSEYWNHGTTYLYCDPCVDVQTCSPTPPVPFITVWTTTTSLESITLPYETTGSYAGSISWGDGITSKNTYSNRTHTYTTPGTYTITITGTLVGWSFYLNPISGDKIIEVLQWGCFRISNNSGYFYGCNNIDLLNVSDTLNLTGANNLSLFFTFCYSITTINNIDLWDVSNIVDMTNMFTECYDFNDDITNWDVSNVLEFAGMFDFSTSFNQPISGWNVSNSINMSYMFTQTSSFNQDLSSWNVSNVTNMKGMFNGSVFNNNGSPMISGWTTSNVIDMGDMFSTSSFNQPINSWDVSNVINMSYMFSSSNFNQPLSGWNVSSVTTMQSMFETSTSFNQNIGNWVVSNVSNFTNFMTGKTFSDYSTTNLDSIYNGWSSLPSLQSGININFGTIKYTAGSSAGKSILIGTYGWTITDGGI